MGDANDESLVPYVTFALDSGEMMEQIRSAEVVIEVDSILQRNWVWAENTGMLLFNAGSNNFGRAFFFLSQTMQTVNHIRIPVSSSTAFDLSPEGYQFLFEEGGDGTWTIYNLIQGEVLSTFSIENLNRWPGIVWYTPESFIYTTRIRDQDTNENTLFIQSITGERRAYEAPGSIVQIEVLRSQ